MWNTKGLCIFLDNQIGDEGAIAIAKSLKRNTTLEKLNLECKSELHLFLQLHDSIFDGLCIYLVNPIGDEAKQSLRESIAQNKNNPLWLDWIYAHDVNVRKLAFVCVKELFIKGTSNS